ncbi:MAG: CoB--CoM heterodisulfide reductase iron-sulfur subunit A family protein [Proteobacteria bacterium]|nr:CoB--CoM heterodisulfide reductase iron-sulfur subunit A family protein [Pseudomonadota bacterium]MBU4470615.1 CoB--CoM heterodisulfide reductase iron-sulfur subunit A family protein [Pseudomonadota bacterium]MCG2753340.1 CoB--CoM heterodisulfide reductase iron-sulfur subunit A family protein [Desulfobacteraceae bacterium]
MQYEPVNIGVYTCHCGMNIFPKVDVEAVAEFARSLDFVTMARDYKFMCSNPGQEYIIEDIQKNGINRVVVASCSPRMHEPTFRKTCENAGINPHYFQMANIREQVAWVTLDSKEATEKAKDLVAAAVARVAHHQPLISREVEVKKSVLVLGGGIAGMQAAISSANAGYEVFLVEREASIGGHMAKFDKTFPTLDCAACIMTPKMVEVGQHKNIKLFTYSELISVEGFVGNFTARILKKPRYVDMDKCTGCGVCMEKCPTKKIPNEFNESLDFRTAIYSPFPQAVPNTPVIDPNHCRILAQQKKCGACEKFCEAHAIDFGQQPEEVEISVGAVIVATGFKAFDPTPMVQYGYGLYPEVYTSLEFERLNNATGPTSGQILKKDGTPPKKVAIIHCVGSRDKNHREYCSRVCCMYSMKFAHLVREKTGAEVWEFYIDVRSPGKLYEEFYNRVQEEEVHMIRGRVAEVTDILDNPGKQENQGRLTVVAENTLSRKTLRIPVDMVILSVGLEPARGALDVGRMVGVSSDKNGWFTELHAKLAPVSTPSKGIFLAGCCQGPKDIPDTVAQAMAASGEAVALLSKGTVTTLTEISYIDPDLCTGCKTCIASCSYKAISFDEGSQIAVVNEALCQGCGSCSAACPSSAAGVRHFTDKQVMDELEAILL